MRLRSVTLIVTLPLALAPAFIAGLRGHNISARAYFSPPVHQLACYRGRARRDLDLSWTEYVSDSVLVLPVHPEEPPTVAGGIAVIVRSLAR